MKSYKVKVTNTIKANRECSNCGHKWIISKNISTSSESWLSAETAAENAKETLKKKEPADIKHLISSDKGILCSVCNHFAKSAMKGYFSKGFAYWLINAYSKSHWANAIGVIVLVPISLLLVRTGYLFPTILAGLPAFFSIWCLINFLRYWKNNSKLKKTVNSFSDEEIHAVTVKTYKEHENLEWKKIIEILLEKKSGTIPWLKFKSSGWIIIITFIGLGIYYTRYDLGIVSAIRLRSNYTTLSKAEVGSMLKEKVFFSKEITIKGEITNQEFSNPNGGFRNYYHLKNINGEKVVIDKTTGLMWHCMGSVEKLKNTKVRGGRLDKSKMSYENSQQWIKNLNLGNFAGYSDWRLPTLEEAASLMENHKSTRMNSGELYIDSLFSRHRNKWRPGDRTKVIWTGDMHGSDNAWIVDFERGIVSSLNLNRTCQIRSVRSIK